MIVQLSTGAVDAMMDSPGLRAAFNGGGMELKLYAGTMPADANAAVGGATLLATIKSGTDSLLWDTSSGGILSKPVASVWSGVAVALGTAVWGRFIVTGDAGTASTSAVRVQGDVATIGAFINLDNPAMSSGAVQTINSCRFMMPRQ